MFHHKKNGIEHYLAYMEEKVSPFHEHYDDDSIYESQSVGIKLSQVKMANSPK